MKAITRIAYQSYWMWSEAQATAETRTAARAPHRDAIPAKRKPRMRVSSPSEAATTSVSKSSGNHPVL